MPSRLYHRFTGHEGGGLTMQVALVFCAVGLGLALVGPPVLENATPYLTAARQYGIDTTTTGSVTTTERYTICKSVLSAQPQLVCGAKVSPACLPSRR